MTARSLGILHTPEVYVYSLEKHHDIFFVLATDGVWDGLTNHQVCQVVFDILDKPPQYTSEELTRASLEALEKERVDDNTTNVVVVIRWTGEDLNRKFFSARKRAATWRSEASDDWD